MKCGQASYDKEINYPFSKLLSEKTFKLYDFPLLFSMHRFGEREERKSG